jgi:deoxyinosine 3'endonuclease (endonuclease V)
LASYVGVILGIQTIGVAKKLHIGSIEPRVGDEAPVLDNGEIIGKAVWLGRRKAVYVSVGNNVTLTTSVEIAKASSTNGDPEPLRHAHSIAKSKSRKQSNDTVR